MASLEQVAKAAGVSTATVSRALSGKATVSPETRERVQHAASQLGYVVSVSASSLASGRTLNVGIVMPILNVWFFTTVMKGAHSALTDAGYDLTVYHLDCTNSEEIPDENNPRRRRLFEQSLLRRRVDGLIAVGLALTPNEVARLHSIDKPVVGLGGPLPGVPTLRIDDEAAVATAVRHLVDLGHTRIAHLAGRTDVEWDFHVPSHRRQGFEDAMAAAGLAPDPAITVSTEFTIEGGYRAARQLLEDSAARFTAIFCASDEMAIGAIFAARDLGVRVPQDVSIIGIDGHELGEFLGLTTVDQDPERQGELAARRLLDQLEGRSDATTDEVLPIRLHVLSSTAAPSTAGE